MDLVEQGRHRIVDDETLITLRKDSSQIRPMPMDRVRLIIEMDDLARHDENESIRTVPGPPRTPGRIQQFMSL